jgi:hypothetical protein
MKSYKIKSIHRGRETIHEGTVAELAGHTFSYTLLKGHSWNSKIPLLPKTAKALVNALNRSVAECMGGCYDPDSYELVTEATA